MIPTKESSLSYPVILFFDGECSFCSLWVNFVLRWEKSPHKIQFCASQSKQAQQWLTQQELQLTPSTILFLEKAQLRQKSDAVLQILSYLKWLWPLAYLGRLIPKKIRDILYDQIAQNRYALIRKTCAVIRDRNRFLD